MASFHVFGLAAPSLLPISRLRYPNPIILHTSPKRISSLTPNPHLSLPFGITMAKRQRGFVASASNSNPSGEEISGNNSYGGSEAGGKGPPLLTILAGFGVFFFVLWVLKSIVIWFGGLIIKLAYSK